jgi:hypothetical protein
VRLQFSDDEAKLLKQIGKQYQELLPVLERARTAELEAMASGSPEHFSTYKGRVQCLSELLKAIRS